jgi:hypothetical protein
MATSTLIQRLDTNALVPSSTVPGGYDLVSTPDVSNRRQIETFIGGDAENYTLVGRTITAEAAGFADVYVHGIHN